MRTYKGIIYESYKSAAVAMGLVKDDVHMIEAFDEAVTVMMPESLRKFFAHLIIVEDFNVSKIWNNYKKFFVEGFENDCENRALLHINSILQGENLSCTDYGLPEPLSLNQTVIDHEEIACYKKLVDQLYPTLKEDQKFIFDEVIKGKNKLIYVDGPGGTGKTYLYKVLIYYCLSLRKKVLPIAWTGIASILLPRGMTSHRTFHLPIDLEKYETLIIEKERDKKILLESDLIIWDECSMIPKKALIDITLKDLCNNQMPFGGKIVLLGGNFRQILPVVRFGHKESTIDQTIKRSHLWPLFKTLKLTNNIRSSDAKFSKFLMKIGDGELSNFRVPDTWKTDNICLNIFRNINSSDCRNRVILSSHNDNVRRLNKKFLSYLEGDEKVYYSIDYATHKGSDKTDDNIYFKFPLEYLNSINSGLPPHELMLKINSIVMLIRNLSPSDGLCNGTRLKRI